MDIKDKNLIREQLGSISLDTTYVDEMEQSKRKEFLAAVNILAQNKELQLILNKLINNQILFTAKEAMTIEQLSFGRGSINGLTLLKEEIETLSLLYLDENKKEEDFDKFKAI